MSHSGDSVKCDQQPGCINPSTRDFLPVFVGNIPSCPDEKILKQSVRTEIWRVIGVKLRESATVLAASQQLKSLFEQKRLVIFSAFYCITP